MAFLLLLFFLLGPSTVSSRSIDNIILPLHHPQLVYSPSSLSFTVDDIIQSDEYRVKNLISRIHYSGEVEQKKMSEESFVKIPLDSGLSLGVGNFVTKIQLGTPAKEYIMVVDTGSTLTWLQCQPCLVSCYDQEGPLFNPNSSTTYSTVACSSSDCSGLVKATLNKPGCTKDGDVCIYVASYGDSSFSVGYLVKDRLSFGKSTMLPDFTYGCGQNNVGLFGKAGGLIGLSKNNMSMLGQLSTKVGKAFTYCLPTFKSTSSGYLSIGSSKSTQSFSYTPLIQNSLDSSLYYVNLTDITVGSDSISVPASAYAAASTIIDSGTVITRLPTSVYVALSKAVSKSLSKHTKAPPYSILDTCFKGTYRSLSDPKIGLVFADGAKLKLAPINTFYDIDYKGITCLAFAGDSGDVAIIGNVQQLTFSFSYDVANSRLGFAPGGCT